MARKEFRVKGRVGWKYGEIPIEYGTTIGRMFLVQGESMFGVTKKE